MEDFPGSRKCDAKHWASARKPEGWPLGAVGHQYVLLTLFQLGRDNFYHRVSISRDKA